VGSLLCIILPQLGFLTQGGPSAVLTVLCTAAMRNLRGWHSHWIVEQVQGSVLQSG
jgi:hypothetical protein